MTTPATTSRNSLRIEPYIVEQPHVKVTLKIRRAFAEFLAARTDLIRSQFGRDVMSGCLPALFEIRDGRAGPEVRTARTLAAIHGPIGGARCDEITLNFPQRQWETVQELASYLDLPAEHVIRGMLALRVESLKLFDKRPDLRTQAMKTAPHA